MLSSSTRNAIDKELDTIIAHAEELVDNTITKKSKLEKSQIRKLVELAQPAKSVRLLKNFIYYQIGREFPWKEQNFGEKLISDFDATLGPIAKTIAEKTQDNEHEIHREIVRLYLGYLNRYFVYKKGQR